MIKGKVGLFLVIFVLVSSMFFPSAQLAFAITEPVSGSDEHITSDETHVSLTISPGGKLTIDSPFTLSITDGLLTVSSGGQLIIEDGATLEFTGTNPLSGITNQGVVDQFGAIVFVPPVPSLVNANSGIWTLGCNGTTTGGPLFQGTPIIPPTDCTVPNDPPTLDSISDPAAILEDASAQVVALSGIGGDDGGTQTLTVTATSDNTSLVPDPTETYTSPDYRFIILHTSS